MSADARGPTFPSTRWSRILLPAGERDLDALARAYAPPIEAWLAKRFVRRAADAADLAQDAFAWLLQTKLLDKADPARGRFRAFLKTALAHFAIERLRKERAAKRGGGARHASLDDVADLVDPDALAPDEALDQAWRRELLAKAQRALQQELEAGGRAVHWALFRDWYLADDEADHATLASRHGITRTDVSNWLDFGKRRYRALLRDVVADTVSSPDELEEELRWLFGPVAGARS
ncbi:MAG: hypothetical protein JNK78_05625 [Planctomycetes bacterium]|nr:hypothetical protein [Planctomycetota bacterium]